MTKIHLAVDSGRMPVYFELSGGQVHDVKLARTLVVNSPDCQIVVADMDYYSDEFRDYIAPLGYDSKIPRKLNKKRGNAQMDWCLYRYRYLVENAFMKTKRFRAIATRYDNLAGNYEATVSLAFTMMWLPMSVD